MSGECPKCHEHPMDCICADTLSIPVKKEYIDPIIEKWKNAELPKKDTMNEDICKLLLSMKYELSQLLEIQLNFEQYAKTQLEALQDKKTPDQYQHTTQPKIEAPEQNKPKSEPSNIQACSGNEVYYDQYGWIRPTHKKLPDDFWIKQEEQKQTYPAAHQLKQQWISCKDRLPPQDGTPFLCYDPEQIKNFQNACVYVVRFEKETDYNDNRYIEAGGECYFEWEPTHWMELPQPPEPTVDKTALEHQQHNLE